MVIREITANKLLSCTRDALHLPPPGEVQIDDSMLAALLRRAAGFLCPCSRMTLMAAILESLQYLPGNCDELPELIENAVEALIVGGDLLELSHVAIDDPANKGNWVFAAPPGFVVRPNGSVFLIGVAHDEATPLPTYLSSRIIYQGFTRVIEPKPLEDLASILREFRLRELSESAWLKLPKVESVDDLFKRMVSRLAEQPQSGHVDDCIILDPSRSVRYYNSRWTRPTNECGNFIARRPQAFGAPLWGFSMLKDGVIIKFLDFPFKGSKWRGCDVAWHLQLAIDHKRGVPQIFRRRQSSNGAFLDFFSPLPLWAQRRLMIIGRPASRDKCLISYWIPDRELMPEEDFLQNRLWLAKSD